MMDATRPSNDEQPTRWNGRHWNGPGQFATAEARRVEDILQHSRCTTVGFRTIDATRPRRRSRLA